MRWPPAVDLDHHPAATSRFAAPVAPALTAGIAICRRPQAEDTLLELAACAGVRRRLMAPSGPCGGLAPPRLPSTEHLPRPRQHPAGRGNRPARAPSGLCPFRRASRQSQQASARRVVVGKRRCGVRVDDPRMVDEQVRAAGAPSEGADFDPPWLVVNKPPPPRGGAVAQNRVRTCVQQRGNELALDRDRWVAEGVCAGCRS